MLNSETVSQSFDAKALYYLSRDTTPEEATKDALKAAKKGAYRKVAKYKGLEIQGKTNRV